MTVRVDPNAPLVAKAVTAYFDGTRPFGLEVGRQQKDGSYRVTFMHMNRLVGMRVIQVKGKWQVEE